MQNVIKALKESGELHDYEDYFVYGNPVNPSLIVLFEKRWSFEKVIDIFKDSTRLFVCSLGIPSNKCLTFIKKLQTKKIIYFGDLDPISLFTYLTFLYAKRKLTPKDKIKFQIEYAGISASDYKNYLSDKNVLIKLPDSEQIVLDFIKKSRLLKLKQELKFLEEKNAKVEIEAMRLYGFEKYFKTKF